MHNYFSREVKETISLSRGEAVRLGNDFIGAEHLLLGLIRNENVAVRILQSFNVNIEELRKEIELTVKDNAAYRDSLPLNKEAENVIREAVAEAKALKSKEVQIEHLILSILKNKENAATQILNQVKRGLQ